MQAAKNVAVVGSGFSGAAAAVACARRGLSVTLLDLGRHNPGGRSASRLPRSPSDAQFDHGAQAIPPPRTPQFAALLKEWEAAGLLAPWQGHFRVLGQPRETGFLGCLADDSGEAANGASCSSSSSGGSSLFVGVPSMSHIISRHIASAPGVKLVLGTRVSAAHLGPSSNGDGVCWQLQGMQAGGSPASGSQQQDLGSFDALIVTDSLAAKKGSPGEMTITVDPTLASLQSSCPDASTDAPVSKDSKAAPGQQQGHGPEGGASEAVQGVMQQMAGLQRVPLFTLMATVQGPADQPLLPFSAAAVSPPISSNIEWIAVDSSKPGRPHPNSNSSHHSIVAITSPSFAADLLGAGPEGTAGPLPAQTPEYLAERAQRIWQELQTVLSAIPGCTPLPPPLSLSAHRWGSAYATPALGSTCFPVVASSQSTSPAGSPAAAAVFVAAGDFCLGPGIENAVVSGLAAADAVADALLGGC